MTIQEGSTELEMSFGNKTTVFVDKDLEDIVPDFLDNRVKDVRLLKDALEQKDFPTIKALGHSMKGSGGGYGFDRISEIGRVLETAAKNENADTIQKQTISLDLFLNNLEVVYKEFE